LPPHDFEPIRLELDPSGVAIAHCLISRSLIADPATRRGASVLVEPGRHPPCGRNRPRRSRFEASLVERVETVGSGTEARDGR
jgi:hypothetical protein